ncbi:DNA segregation ATPase FtsK/SpoIIIE [Campylobacter mucosalis]|nr:DNA segregation ATPase FtsK/SpoIIIE [Campylobacter mucosalis]
MFNKFREFNLEFAQILLGTFLFAFGFLMLEALLFNAPLDGLVGRAINDVLNGVIGKLGTIVVVLCVFILSVGLVFQDGVIGVINNAFVKPNEPVSVPVKTKQVEKKQEILPVTITEQVTQNLSNEEVMSVDEKELMPEQLRNINEIELEEPAIKRVKIKGVEILSEVAENKKLLDELEKGKLEKPKDFTLPPLKFLADPPKRQNHINEAEIDQKISDLLDKLRKFKINGDVVRTYTGPIVTTFEFRPAPDVKVSKILTLQDDLAMALKAQTIRIQAPIPGKDVVGIEVPNQNTETIYLKEILDSEIFKNASSPLTMALGKDIVGTPFVTDLKKLPHLLIAGTTGSGKSVGINAMLLSLLYRNSPQTLRLMMIDPKMLEFSIYNDIPHLLTPVITQAKQAITALSNMVAEMERRYTIMSHTRTKNIESYNEKMKAEGGEQLPYIVVIIDELADLMMTSGKDVELYIGRLAQMARASGIHLIVATQRPSVDVVTGLIKANLPSRVSYRVGQRVDSKVILDQMGAESLLGRGDMLFTPPGSPGIIRLHAPFASEKEIENIVEFLKSQQEVVYDEKFLAESGSGSSENGEVALSAGELDPLYNDAKEIVLSEQKTSISYLQRRLGVGYNRSANILEQMERMGVLSPLNAKGQREIL